MTTEIRILKAILVRLQMELNKTYLETSILDIKCQGTWLNNVYTLVICGRWKLESDEYVYEWKKILYCLSVLIWGHSCVQGLLLALSSRITPVGLCRSYPMLGNELRLITSEASDLLFVLSFQLQKFLRELLREWLFLTFPNFFPNFS